MTKRQKRAIIRCFLKVGCSLKEKENKMQTAEHWVNNDLLGRSYSKADGSTEHWANGCLLGRSYKKANNTTEHFGAEGQFLGRSYEKTNGNVEHWSVDGCLTARSHIMSNGTTEHWQIRNGLTDLFGRTYHGKSAPIGIFSEESLSIHDEICEFGIRGGDGTDGEVSFIGIAATAVVVAGFLAVYTTVVICKEVYSFIVGIKEAIDQGIEKAHREYTSHLMPSELQ